MSVASVAIEDGRVLIGSLPPGALRLVREWIGLRRVELEAAAKAAKAGRKIEKIAPLRIKKGKKRA